MYEIIAELTVIFQSRRIPLNDVYRLFNSAFLDYSILSHNIYEDIHNIRVKCTLDTSHVPNNPYQELRAELHFRFSSEISFSSLYVHTTEFNKLPALSFVCLME